MRSVRNILSVACGYVAAIIGAGFASGQEIVSFFVKYGRCSIVGVIISCVLFALFAYAVLGACSGKGQRTYGEFLSGIMGKRLRGITEAITIIFALSTVCVMTACSGEIGYILFGAEKIIGAAVFIVICGVIMLMDGKKIMGINSVLGAVIIFGIIFSSLYILRFREHQTFSREASMVVSGVTYAGYNLLTAGAVLSGMSRFLRSKREAALAAASSGIMLFIMMTLLWGVLSIYHGKVNLGEIPMLTMTLRQSKAMGCMYSVLLFFAVLTTGVANCFGIADMTEGKINRKYAAVITLAAGLAFSGAGVATLVNTAYRVCGWAGMIIICIIMYNSLKTMKKVAK